MYERRDWGLGDIVRLKDPAQRRKYPGNYRVKKFLQKNVDLESVDTGSPLRGHPSLFEKVAEGDLNDILDEMRAVNNFALGTVVKVTNAPRSAKWQYSADQKFVVVAVRSDTVNIAKLGGEYNRYWKMSPRSLEIVPEL